MASTAAACSLCNAGSFSSTFGANSMGECLLCDSGSGTGAISQDACLLCPEGSYSTSLGAASHDVCLPCMVGSVSAAGSKKKESCTAMLKSTGHKTAQSCNMMQESKLSPLFWPLFLGSIVASGYFDFIRK